MRKQALPITRRTNRVTTHPLNLRELTMKQRMVMIAAALSIVALSTIGIVTAQGLMNSDDQTVTTHETHAKGSSVTTTTTTPPAVDQPSMPTTNVIVNGQSVPVPTNGSTSKTITNDNGTTHVEISNSNNGNSVSTSVMSSNVSSSTNTYQNSVDIKTNSSMP